MSWLTEEGRMALGRQRIEQFVELHGKMHAELLSSVMSVAFAGKAEYSDEALAALVTDANDFERAAKQYAAYLRRLAKEWRTQRDRPQG